MAELIIIRGLPGSGKSTEAKKYLENSQHIVNIEADMFFTKETGAYIFNPSQLQYAHRWCLDTAKIFLRQEKTVVVSNTFTTFSEIKDYVTFAVTAKIPISIITMTNKFGSIHNVPDYAMERMSNRFVPHHEMIELVDKFSMEFGESST